MKKKILLLIILGTVLLNAPNQANWAGEDDLPRPTEKHEEV